MSCELSVLGSPHSLANVSSPTEMRLSDQIQCCGVVGATLGPAALPPYSPGCRHADQSVSASGPLASIALPCVAAQALLVIVNTAYYYTGRRCTSEMLLGHSRCRGGWPDRIR